MRIAYFAVWSGGPETGVGKKILAQSRCWARAGHEVGLWLLTRSPAWRDVGDAGLHVSSWPSLWRLPAAWLGLRRDLLRCGAEVLYVRQTVWLPGLGGLLRRFPAVVEIQTDDLAELDPLPIKGPWNRLTRRWLLKPARGFVFVTGELAALPHYRADGQPRAVIANAIPDGEPLPPPPPNRPRLVFLGSPGQPWHGTDHLLELARGLPECDVDAIGMPPPADTTSPPNLIWHGWLDRMTYQQLLAAASIGIGSLALYRNRMQEACPLKVREYLANGLPVLIGYRDADFPGGAPWALEIPNAPDGVTGSLPRIRAFVQAWQGRRVAAADIAHLRHDVKESARLDFLARVLAESRRPEAAP